MTDTTLKLKGDAMKDAATKNEAISRMIIEALDNGHSVDEAIDAVLGAGTYAKVASELYDALRK